MKNCCYVSTIQYVGNATIPVRYPVQNDDIEIQFLRAQEQNRNQQSAFRSNVATRLMPELPCCRWDCRLLERKSISEQYLRWKIDVTSVVKSIFDYVFYFSVIYIFVFVVSPANRKCHQPNLDLINSLGFVNRIFNRTGNNELCNGFLSTFVAFLLCLSTFYSKEELV